MTQARKRKPTTATTKKSTAKSAKRDVATRRQPHARRIAELERRCAEAERRAEAAESARAELLTVVSHDLRNPLGVIMVTTTLLTRELESEPAHKRQLDAIKRAASEMNQIVEDLVDAANIDAGRLALGQDVHDAASLVEAAATAAAAATSNRPISLVKEVASELPAVYADRGRVLQVFSRLVGNAARFMHKGGSITLRAERSNDGARFSVSDTGPGIPSSEQPLVFSRQPPPGRRACQGTGLSVFVAKGIIEAHGGHIGAESEVGRGSTIYFTLPAANDALLDEEDSGGR